MTLWTGDLAPVGETLGAARSFEIAGTIPARAVPSIELPHGRTTATFHVILDRPLAPDTHLVRDVAIATTAEI